LKLLVLEKQDFIANILFLSASTISRTVLYSIGLIFGKKRG